MVEAGIVEPETPVPEFSIARQGRETYLYALLFEIGYALANRSANPAAMAWRTLGTKPLTPEERRHIAEYLYGERECGRCSGSPTRSRCATPGSGPENRITRHLAECPA
jgi:hypothetical protein